MEEGRRKKEEGRIKIIEMQSLGLKLISDPALIFLL